jgi:hypothetical protein
MSQHMKGDDMHSIAKFALPSPGYFPYGFSIEEQMSCCREAEPTIEG